MSKAGYCFVTLRSAIEFLLSLDASCLSGGEATWGTPDQVMQPPFTFGCVWNHHVCLYFACGGHARPGDAPPPFTPWPCV